MKNFSQEKVTPESLGALIRQTRKSQRLTQKELALVCNKNIRFIVELEGGKSTCHMGKVLHVLQILNIEIQLRPPAISSEASSEA